MDLSGSLSSEVYNYSLTYSFIQQMFIEHPLQHANILSTELFWVTGKEATHVDGRGNRFKIKSKSLGRKGQYYNEIHVSRLKCVRF